MDKIEENFTVLFALMEAIKRIAPPDRPYCDFVLGAAGNKIDKSFKDYFLETVDLINTENRRAESMILIVTNEIVKRSGNNVDFWLESLLAHQQRSYSLVLGMANDEPETYDKSRIDDHFWEFADIAILGASFALLETSEVARKEIRSAHEATYGKNSTPPGKSSGCFSTIALPIVFFLVAVWQSLQ